MKEENGKQDSTMTNVLLEHQVLFSCMYRLVFVQYLKNGLDYS
jgi:hypothetical protein